MSALAQQQAAVRERPILFSGPMVRAILEGRKTQTRRVVKAVRGIGGVQLVPLIGKREAIYLDFEMPGLSWRPSGDKPPIPWPVERIGEVCPHGAPGDRLWVRETFAAVYDCQELPCCEDGEGRHRRLVYRATEPDGIADYACSFECDHAEAGCARWKPSLFMPRSASRITLEVTGVRVERLQDISEDDAKAEGVDIWGQCNHSPAPCENICLLEEPIAAFAWLWNSINGEGAWGANPWVWVISFRSVQ